jgi:hypothetical protein
MNKIKNNTKSDSPKKRSGNENYLLKRDLDSVPHLEDLLGVIFLFCNMETLFQLKQINKKFREITTTYAGFSILCDFID